VLVAEYVEPSPAPGPGFILAWCTGLLCRLATRSGADLPAGGGWHRLGPTPAVMIARPLTLALWAVAHERMTASQAVARYRSHRGSVEAITAALNGPDRV
jgi:hypothetical protein